MNAPRIVCLCAAVIALASMLPAADSHQYDAPIERVWDEAVKATRDAGLVLTDSDRSENWFTMQTPKKTLTRTVLFEVELNQTGDQTTVSVRSIDHEGSKKSARVIANYFAALDERMN
jgi:hypothetical protein